MSRRYGSGNRHGGYSGGGRGRFRETPLIGGWSDHARVGGYALWNDPNLFSDGVLIRQIERDRRHDESASNNLLMFAIIGFFLLIAALFGIAAFIFIASRLMK